MAMDMSDASHVLAAEHANAADYMIRPGETITRTCEGLNNDTHHVLIEVTVTRKDPALAAALPVTEVA